MQQVGSQCPAVGKEMQKEPKKKFKFEINEQQQICCNGCEKFVAEKDVVVNRRVPKYWGGDDYVDNKQALCGSCYKYKMFLETMFFRYEASELNRREWVRMAFQNDREKLKTFLNDITIALDHVRELYPD